ncbi:MAG: hypothetical protein JSV12_06825 [Candidatus Bathyarchaeota archaeon]|nr:MAG: hypothetical protein JSV12_06825 [Candidatus Bathyarchaeota archaeon]
MQRLSQIKITQVEERPNDAWFDLSLRQLREGKVRFYRVKDFLTGNWLFKVCSDKELPKKMVKAVKCPPGRRFAQLEGNTMLFQKSKIEGQLYDVISLTHADESDRLHRKIVNSLEKIPTTIREHFRIVPYEEATGKRAPGKHWVTLTQTKDEKSMILLFMLERAWTISPISPEEKIKIISKRKKLEPLIPLYVRPKIEREVHVKVKAHAHANKTEVSNAYRSLIESALKS